MRLKILGFAMLGVFSVSGVLVPLPSADQAEAAPADKVTICHSTRSEKNPFVVITVSGNSIPKAHSQHHDGDDILWAAAARASKPASPDRNSSTHGAGPLRVPRLRIYCRGQPVRWRTDADARTVQP